MKDMRHIDIAIDRVERGLYEDMDIETVSRASFVSVAQLYRDFYSATGHSVKEYVRKRRLSNALALVRQSDLSIAAIADRCGYDCAAAFCKTVKKRVSVTPIAYRNGEGFFYFPRYAGHGYRQVAVAKESIPQTLRIEYAAGGQSGVEQRAVRAFLLRFPGYAGRLFGRNGRQPGRYELYTDADYDPAQLPQSLRYIGEFPSFTGTFATMTAKNACDAIQDAWNYLYHRWLPASMFAHAPTPYFEEYLLKNGAPGRVRLFVPVQKRADTVPISIENAQAARYVACSMRGDGAQANAADKLLRFLADRCPRIADRAEQLLVCDAGGRHTCGIRIDASASIEVRAPIRIVSHPAGEYAVLSAGGGDSAFYADVLLSWVRDNGLALEGEPFALYDITRGFDNADMKIYCRLQNAPKARI